MQVLPPELISEEEQPIFGVPGYNLGCLKRAGLPVMNGLVVTAPEIFFRTLLIHLAAARADLFEQQLEIARAQVNRIPSPDDWQAETRKHKLFYIDGRYYKKPPEVWKKLLDIWMAQVKNRLWREGFARKLSSAIKPHVVLLPTGEFKIANAHFDPELEEVIIDWERKRSDDRVAPWALKEIADLVKRADNKLVITQVYRFAVFKNKVEIIGMSPFTQTLPLSQTPEIFIRARQEKKLVKSSVKIFHDLSSGFDRDNQADGVFIAGEKLLDFEKAVFKMSYAALVAVGKPVIYRLPDISVDGINGTAALLASPKRLDQASELLVFLREKKNFNNIEPALPLLRSREELGEIKKGLAQRGLARSSTLKIWAQLSIPENFINLTDYLEAGIDGIIIDLDLLQGLLDGYFGEPGEIYRKYVRTLIKFLRPSLKIISGLQLPVLVIGETVMHPDMLDFLIESRSFGVVANTAYQTQNMPEYLAWSEERFFAKLP